MNRLKNIISVLACVLLITSCAAHRLAGTDSQVSADKGYMLVTIESDLGGLLPIKPDSFWGVPMFIALEANKTYLVQMKSGGYSFGGLTTGGGLGWSTFDTTPFKVAPGKVVYLGKHSFKQASSTTYNWIVEDVLDYSLSEVEENALSEIKGLNIEKAVPIIN